MCRKFRGGVVYLEGRSIWGKYRRPKMTNNNSTPRVFNMAVYGTEAILFRRAKNIRDRQGDAATTLFTQNVSIYKCPQS